MAEIEKLLSLNPQVLEEKVLKAIFKRPSAIIDVMDTIKPEYFTINEYALIYNAMVNIYGKSDEITLENIQMFLENSGTNVDVNILNKLYNESYTSLKIKNVAKNLKELYLRRYMLTKVREFLDNQSETPTLNSEIINKINNIAMECNSAVSRNEKDTKCCVNVEEESNIIFNRLEEDKNEKGLISGIPVIDNELNGLLPTKLWTIVGDSGSGKSAMALNMALSVCLNDPTAVVNIFSLEMDKQECTERLLANLIDIEPRFISNPKRYFNKMDSYGNVYNAYETNKNCEEVVYFKNKIKNGISKLNQMNINIDDTPDLTISDIEARVKRNHLKFGKTSLVIVDHIGLVCTGDTGAVVGLMDEAYSKLKQLAKKLNCTVIALHQFSNELKNDPLRFPNVFSLRGSSAPRHYSDVITSVYRPIIYPEVIKNNPDLKDVCQLVWQKVRYTAKPDVTDMSYNGYKFTQKLKTKEGNKDTSDELLPWVELE